MKRRRLILSFYLTLILSVISCTTTNPTIEYGMTKGHIGYVPARIAVLPCSDWPSTAQFMSLPLSNSKKDVKDELCKEFDRFVLNGFRNQPYMKGYTPKAISKLLRKAKTEGLMSQMPRTWKHLSTDCKDCRNASSFYHYSITQRKDWQSWLSQFSQSTRNSDAILAPYILFTKQETVNDRGLLKAKISAGITMLLIDTNNGDLLWSGARILEETNQVIENRAEGQFPAYPQWEVIRQRLLNSNLWREFPGRLIF